MSTPTMHASRGRPLRLLDDDRILHEAECRAIAERIFAFAKGGGETKVFLSCWWNGELRWARNRVSLAGDRRDIRIIVRRTVGVGEGNVVTNQVDDVSLEAAVRAAERDALLSPRIEHPAAYEPPLPRGDWLETAIWSDATYNLSTEARGEIARGLIESAEAKGMLSAGYMEVRAGARMTISSLRPADPTGLWDTPYQKWTQAQCSMTVRDAKGTGSGWAGLSSYDWNAIDGDALAKRALEKCIASQNAVALEPGRYTVILEPQAVADLMEVFATSLSREIAENGRGPWALAQDDALGIWRSKLGLKVADSRITISHDPMDPTLGIVPREPWVEPITWVERGTLTSLAYERPYAVQKLNENATGRWMTGYRMSGGETSIDEMIGTTRRGLLVTRFSNIRKLDSRSLVSTGLTRDGLWLIENGKISKAVKNFRFTESPLFVLNSIERLGRPVPVFRPVERPSNPALTPAIVPPLEVRDF
ncbi:MAG TPA: metallopeptidase TldD-related protein, partial [Gemmatimonadaceae bacterium]|nr:metallopeptidase TldD-related protein [Gemmatimonadaceae bacterium]